MSSNTPADNSNQSFFIYGMKRIPYDVNLFNTVSQYFSTNQDQQNFNIDLIRDFNGNIILSEKSIQDFVNFCQNQQITIDNDNVILLHKLSTKFIVPTLIEQTEQYITAHHINIISDLISSRDFTYEQFTKDHEDIVCNYLLDFVQSDFLLKFPITIIYRILTRYKLQMETTKIQISIKSFLFKCLIKFGRDASILFDIFDLENDNKDIIDQLLDDRYSRIFDFHYLNQKYLTSDYEAQSEIIKNYLITKKHQDDQIQILHAQMNEIVNIQNEMRQQLINIIQNDLTRNKEDILRIENSINDSIEPLKNDINQNIEKVQQIENSLDDKLQPLKDDLNESKEKVQQIENSLDDKLQPLKDDLNESKDKLQPLKNDLNQSKEDIQRVENAFNDKMNQLKDEINQIDTKKQQIRVQEQVECAENQLNQLKLVMFIILSTKFFDKSDNIKVFNNLRGESQTFIFESLYEQNNSNLLIKKIYNLVNYLSKENKITNYRFNNDNYIYIYLKNNCQNIFEIKEIETIGISSNAIEMLNYNASLTSYYFMSLIKCINEFHVEIEIKYPASGWNYIYGYISSIKETNENINISIIFSDIEKTDETFQDHSHLNSIKIYSNDKYNYDRNDQIQSILRQRRMNNLVKTIGANSFSLCINLSEVILSESITLIESRAFNECTSLNRITIPSSVTYVDEYSFNKCINLKHITYDPYITKIHQNAFSECLLLNHLTLYSSVKSLRYFKCNQFILKYLTIPTTVEYLLPYAFCNFNDLIQIEFDPYKYRYFYNTFEGCSSISHFIFLSTIKNVKQFLNNFRLTEITIPDSVTSIEEKSFYDYKSLEKVNISTSVKSIGNYAFSGCTSLKDFNIPISVTSIGDCAFNECSSLTQIKFSSSVKYIGYCSFRKCTSLTFIEIPSSVEFLGNAFPECSSLKQIIINSSISAIGGFDNCTSLEQIEIPTSVKEITFRAFEGCINLKQITIPSLVTKIDNNAFKNCRLIQQIRIPPSVVSIGDEAFNGCNKLTRVEIPSSLRKFGNKCFPPRVKIIKY